MRGQCVLETQSDQRLHGRAAHVSERIPFDPLRVSVLASSSIMMTSCPGPAQIKTRPYFARPGCMCRYTKLKDFLWLCDSLLTTGS